MQKPAMTASQIWNMSFGFLGIQIGFDLQNGNVSRIFQTLGAEVSELAILWIAAPMTGLLIQPLIGHLSDKTWGRYGRRRPYFLVGAILASLALFVMPNSPALWVAAGMLWIKTVIEPLTIGGCGPGTGGCIGPALVAPLHTHVQPTCAAGAISIITGAAPHIGQGAGAIGPITPLGTSMSCVIGSPIRAAGNIVLVSVGTVQVVHSSEFRFKMYYAAPPLSASLRLALSSSPSE